MNLPGVLLVAVALVVLALAARMRGQAAARLKRAKATGEVEGYVEFVMGQPEEKRANLWDQGITQLWRGYERVTAMKLMKAAAATSGAPVVQFWIRQALEIEPELAAAELGPEFLEEHFRPDVAARCGRVGCCG